jgi:hypothetical protein
MVRQQIETRLRHADVAFYAADYGREFVVGEVIVDRGREGWDPHAEGGFVDVADGLVGFVDLQQGVGVAQFFAELAGYEDGDVEDAGLIVG